MGGGEAASITQHTEKYWENVTAGYAPRMLRPAAYTKTNNSNKFKVFSS